jgi:rubrerythrin
MKTHYLCQNCLTEWSQDEVKADGNCPCCGAEESEFEEYNPMDTYNYVEEN